MFSHSQNAWETKRPDEIVGDIFLAIPPGAETVDDPIKNAALIARIGAKRIGDDSGVNVVGGTKYELKNASTGTRFTFKRRKFYGNEYWHWQLRRED